MSESKKAVVTVLDYDRKGIIAKVSAVLYECDANIVDISQTVLSGLFNMVLVADISSPDCAFDQLSDRLARLARENGIDGVVCSPHEAARMRELLGEDALVVTPGVRPAGAALGDQSRVATPAEALSRGASHIVVGRPITGADDPVAVCDAIVAELVRDA